jgi:2-oxoglutarate dehydrogenase E2 component (dihydrolipoamide succinyltransferase)
MAIDVKVPSVGESVTEGTLARWVKRDGDQVREGETLFELETDKATGEVPSPATGRLKVLTKEGETVAVGAVVARIEPAADGAAAAPAAPKAPTPAAVPAPAPPKAEPKPPPRPEPARPEPARPEPPRGEAPAERPEEPRPAPAAPAAPPSAPPREEARPAAPAFEPPPPPPPGQRESRRPMSRLRRTIADRLVQAQQTAAILTTFNEADLTQVIALRNQYKDAFKERHGVSLGFMSFFIKAAVEALKAFPVLNAAIDGNDIVYYHTYDIGVAVSTERGLMVPVIRGAERLSLAELEKAVAHYAAKARDGKITVDDLQGGTFTITNGGVFGSLLSTPILNPPQSGILGMHAIQKRPVVVDDQVVIRPMMYLALSYDHRLIDGREAVQFLVKVKQGVENPLGIVWGL